MDLCYLSTMMLIFHVLACQVCSPNTRYLLDFSIYGSECVVGIYVCVCGGGEVVGV